MSSLQKMVDQFEICAICGNEEKCTRDHIPPKSIFLPPRPSNLVTVPACINCNQGSSKYDERFKAFLAMHVARHNEKGEKFFKAALRTIKHNKSLERYIFKNAKPVDFKTAGGIFLGKGASIKWDSEAHDKIIERTIRGLFYHHYGKILGDKVDLSVHWHKSLPKELLDFYTEKSWMGKDEFIYLHTQTHDSPLSSIWIFQFYNAHWASGITVERGYFNEG